MVVYNNVLAGAAGSGGGGYEIEHSLRFNPGDSPQLKRDFTEAGNRRTWTFSCWVKRTTSFNTYRHTIASGPGTTLSFSENAQGGSDSWFFYVDGTPYLLSDEVLRDTAAWYHVVFVFDTTNATAADRCRLYKNGVRVTSWRNTAYPAQNFEGSFNTAGTHKIGYGNANEVLDGYLADVHFVDGQALDPTSFGEFDDDTGVWNPIRYSGTYGQNGFKLVFDPTAGFGDDTNGGMTTLVTTSNITAVSTSTVSLGGSSTGGASTSQSEVANAFDNNTSTLFGYTGGGNTPALIKEWTFSTGLPVKAGDVISYEGTKGAGFKAGVFLANGQVVGGNYPYPNVDSVTASSDTTITKINAGSFGGGNQYSNIKKLTINGVAYPLSATELTLTDTTGLSNLSTGHEIIQTGGTATGTIYRISGTTVDLTQTTNTWSTGSTANKPSLPITNDFTATNLTTSVQSVQSSPITAVATVNTWNQDKVWSNFVSGPRQGSNPWSNAFNGSIHSNVDVAGSTSLNQSFTGVTSFRFATVINQPVTISGTGITTQTWSTAGWKTVTLTSTSISNIVVSPGPGESMTYPSAFEVNGEILVDQGVSGNQVISNTLTLTDTTNLDALSVGDVVYPGNKQITAINTSTPSIVVNGGAFQVGGVVSKPGTFGDDVIDTPTNIEQLTGNAIGNYCTLNTLNKSDTATISNGGLSIVDNVDSDQTTGTIAVSSGKYYFEATITTYSGTQQDGLVGISDVNRTNFQEYVGKGAYSYGIAIAEYNTYMKKYNGNTAVDTDLTPPVLGDTVGVAFDLDNGKVYFHKNGVYANGGNPATGSNPAYTGISGTFAPAITCSGSTGGTVGWDFNFGQRGSFDYALPTGFKTLCTENLDDPLIADGSDYFDVALYTGNGTTGQSITGLEFSPDLVWIKERNNSGGHSLVDTVRGATKPLMINTNNEYTKTQFFDSFDSNGFSVDYNGVDSSLVTNRSGKTYAAWTWDGGDLVTNSAYNQDRVWSDGVTFSGTILEPATKAFDGNSATSAAPYDANGGGGTPQYVEVTFSPGIPYTSSVKVERQNGNPTGYTVSMNGGTAINSVFQAYTTVATGSGTLTSIKVQNNGSTNTAGISRIEVDGKVLVDKGVIPVGSLNSTLYNTSQNWSSAGSNMQNNWNTSFDGKDNPTFALPNTGYSASMTFPSPISYQTLELVVSRDIYAPDLLMNGNALNVPATDTNTTGGNYKIETLTFSNGTLSSIGHNQRTVAGRGGSGFWKIIVDGKILVDTNQASGVDNIPSIASTCRVNQTAGMSIVSFTGTGAAQTTGHGLNKKPSLVLLKNRTSSNTHWQVFGDDFERLQLSTTQSALSGYYTLERTSTTISPTMNSVSELQINQNGDDFIAYCFNSVDSYSAFGKYTGNGSTTGPFVFTGFRPAFIIVKRLSGTARNWVMIDTARSPANEADEAVYPNLSNAEDTGTDWADILSNGFKTRNNNASWNTSGAEYAYFCWAETPFKYARAR